MVVGDVHRDWDPVFREVVAHRPAAVVLLGDLNLTAPLRRVCAPILEAGAALRWIPGNHDRDTPEDYDRLWGDAPDWSLHRRVASLGGRRVAGLGGVFRGRVWYPKDGYEQPVVRTETELLRHGREGQPRFRGGTPLRHRDTILPDDLDTVRQVTEPGVDILVTHEAPSCMRRPGMDLGFGAIDNLARDVRAQLVVHGHHHTSYVGCTKDGIRVVGLSKAECLVIPAGKGLP